MNRCTHLSSGLYCERNNGTGMRPTAFFLRFQLIPVQQPFFHTFLDYPHGYPVPGVIVPQQIFAPPPAQVIPAGQQFPVVRFAVNGRPGISLVQARTANNIPGLTQIDNNMLVSGDADTVPALTNNAAFRISVRILVSSVARIGPPFLIARTQWPGYPPWFYQMHAANNQLHPFSLSRLASRIAAVVERFLEVLDDISRLRTRADYESRIMPTCSRMWVTRTGPLRQVESRLTSSTCSSFATSLWVAGSLFSA